MVTFCDQLTTGVPVVGGSWCAAWLACERRRVASPRSGRLSCQLDGELPNLLAREIQRSGGLRLREAHGKCCLDDVLLFLARDPELILGALALAGDMVQAP
jgi:hypothetical protein